MNVKTMQEQDIETKAVEWRRAFHEDPEISYHEERTQQRIAQILRDMGLEPTLGTKHHGVMATIVGDAQGPVVALRADMDGTGEELTGSAF